MSSHDPNSIPTKSAYPMIPMSEALATIVAKLAPLPPATVPVSGALDRVLAHPVHSPTPVPAFRASVKDGYAIALPPPDDRTWAVVRASFAGDADADADADAHTLQNGQAAYVTTGAPVPRGAHAVVMVEHCDRAGDLLTVPCVPRSGADIRAVGADVAHGQLLLAAGAIVGAAEIGLLHSCGVSAVSVYARPTLGVLSSGDELVDAVPDRAPPRLAVGRVVDSNRPMLLAAARSHLPFCDVVDLGIARDDAAAMRATLAGAARRCHIVVSSGGVSMGARDAVKPGISAIGATVHFGRVCMKPGKPLTFATASTHRCFVALPGNPVSAFVCFHLAVAVAARRLAGVAGDAVFGAKVEARLANAITLDPARPEFHRACLRWVDGKGYEAVSTGAQASSRLLSARSADALLELPARDGKLPAGSVVRAVLL